uniref:Gustatory receptor n=1 Tax=Anopheles epiroticus TaxID=199890 RepID=A0A182PR70_9DIPT
MDLLKQAKNLKLLIPTSSTDWWVQFRKWEELCCPKQPTVRLVLLFSFFLIMELSVFILTLVYIPSRMHTSSFFLDNGVPAILIIGTTGSVVKLSHMFSQRKRFGVISSALQHFDQTLQRLDFQLRCDEVLYWTAGWSLSFGITTLFFSVAVHVFGCVVFKHVGPFLMVVFLNITNIPYIVFMVWFILLEICVWCRLKLLHSLIDSGMRLAITGKRMGISKRPNHLLAGLSDLHAELSSVVGHISAAFGVQITVSLCAYTILLIFCIFSYYRAAVVMGEIETNFAWLTVCWSLYNSCFMIPMILFGAFIRQSSDKLTTQVHHHLRHASELVIQNQQMDHYSFAIHPWFYTIEWSVYALVIGYVSTYVVILIQFDSKTLDISRAHML